MTGCGSTPRPTLVVTPESGSIFTSYQAGDYEVLTLTARLSNGQIPSGLVWRTTEACIPVQQATVNTATVLCNFTCSGQMTATVTAAYEGQTASSSVSCTWR